ncbi:hypothetical protein LTR95_011916 [Oleoguttula sp. CCFEE 5521]
MPAQPKEEETHSNIHDQVAKESNDSTASTHELHNEGSKATSGGLASAQDHQANPGPAIVQSIGEASSKEENRKRAAELNK